MKSKETSCQLELVKNSHAMLKHYIAVSALYEIKHGHATKILIKHKVKLSALLALRPHAECFILCKA